jgi:hypothetical protein
MTAPSVLYGGSGYRIARSLEGALFGLTLVGLVVVIAGATAVGVALFAVGVIGGTAVHLAVGIAGYRRAMQAEWPKVPPLSDDDWDA